MRMDWLDSLVATSFRFGPPEHTALLCLALALVVALVPGSILRACSMAALGMLVGTVWDADPANNLQRELLGIHIAKVVPLPALMLVFGFLIPRIAHYAHKPTDRRMTTTPRLAYEGILLIECLPALLLMRQPWLPQRLAVPLAVAWSAALWVHFELEVEDLLLSVPLLGIGLLLMRARYPWPPLLIGLQTSATLETQLRRSLLLSEGDWGIFLDRPICAALLGFAVLALLASAGVRLWLGHRRRGGAC